MSTPKLSIIVPTYCEAENIRPLVQRILAALAGGPDIEIIFVDDNSQDETVARVEELAREGAPVRAIVRRNERGLSSAIFRGFQEAKGDLLLCMDADQSHPAEAIPEMLRAQAAINADLVVGSRYVKGGSIEEGWGFYRWLNSQVALWLVRPLSKIRDAGAGFFLLPRRVFEQGKDFSPIGYKALLEIIVKCPCQKVVEVPIHFSDRKFGESKLNFREQFMYLVHLKRLYDYRFGNLSRFLQFGVIGASGFVVNLLSYNVLNWLGLPQKPAYAMAIWLSLTWNFFPNRYFTFEHAVRESAWRQYLHYALTCAIGMAINYQVFIRLVQNVDWFHNHHNWAILAGVASGTLFNFILSSRWAFRLRDAGEK